MNNMGWKLGEGIGSRNQGITEMIHAPKLKRQAGLGWTPAGSSVPLAQGDGEVEVMVQEGPRLSTLEFASKRRYVDSSFESFGGPPSPFLSGAPFQRLKTHRPQDPPLIKTIFDQPGEALLNWERQQREALGSFPLPRDLEDILATSASSSVTDTESATKWLQ
jgi:hypothetical protein